MLLGRKMSLPALFLEIPQWASLIVFLLTLLPVPELSLREIAVPLVLLMVLVCTTTVLAELKLTAVLVELMLLPVAFTLGPAL
jgi:hypothetical protein